MRYNYFTLTAASFAKDLRNELGKMEKQNCERRAMKRNNLRVEVWKRFENSRYHVIFTNIGTLMDKFVSERRSASICFTKRYHR